MTTLKMHTFFATPATERARLERLRENVAAMAERTARKYAADIKQIDEELATLDETNGLGDVNSPETPPTPVLARPDANFAEVADGD